MHLLNQTLWNLFVQNKAIKIVIYSLDSLIDPIIEKYRIMKDQSGCPSVMSSLLHLVGRHLSKHAQEKEVNTTV